jgi:hypothetical protein
MPPSQLTTHPRGSPPVLSQKHFDEWAAHYLDSDRGSRTCNPVGVKVPSGPFNDILRAWHGELSYDPALVQAPVGPDQSRVGWHPPR